MWLQDLEKAIAKMREERCDFNFICLESVRGRADGAVVFKTTYFTYIVVYRNGVIEEYKEDGTRYD